MVRLEIQCLRDQGFAVEVIPPGDGISFSNVPSEQMGAANRTFWACQAGLNLPEFAEPSEDQLEEHYYYLLELRNALKPRAMRLVNRHRLTYSLKVEVSGVRTTWWRMISSWVSKSGTP